jgi:hypothetical protein
MPQISLNCPHEGCLTEKVAFTGSSYMEFDPTNHIYIALMQCAICHNGVVVKCQGSVPIWMQGHHTQVAPRVLDYWPKRAPTAVPESIPDNVRGFYLQAKSNQEKGHWDAAGAMFRKALDTSLRAINHAGRGTIFERIEACPRISGSHSQ